MLKDYDDVIVAVQQPDGETVCMCMDHHILTTTKFVLLLQACLPL
mgnify:CR=1 FL=1